MKVQNFATFGLFDPYGRTIAEGSIQRLENEAIRLLKCREYASLRISVRDSSGREGLQVLKLKCALGEIQIKNALTEKPKPRKTHSTLIEIKDTIDELLECDSLVERDSPDAVSCNIGGGTLWTEDLAKLQKHYNVKGIFAEGDHIALLIENRR